MSDRNYTKKTFQAVCILVVLYAVFYVAMHIANYANNNTVVVTTPYGDCYHRPGCSTIGGYTKQTTIGDAVRAGYGDCDVCNAPTLIEARVTEPITLWTVLDAAMRAIPVSLFMWCFHTFIAQFFSVEPDEIRFLWHYLAAFVFFFIP